MIPRGIYHNLIAPHPMNPNVSWSTGFNVEVISNGVLIIRDNTRSNGMSVTNNMENVLTAIARHFRMLIDDLDNYTIYQIDDDALFRIEHDCCIDVKWVYMGPDDKALRVLYGTKET